MGLSIGAHLSAAGSYYRMGQDALSIGANTLQFFTRNPRGARARQIHYEDFEAFRQLLDEHHFAPIIAHAPYTMNLCSADEHLRSLSAQMLEDDLQRMELLPGNLYNFHPGSRLKQTKETAVTQIADALNRVMFPEMRTTVLLETMAGKGSEVGRRFEELCDILDRCEHKDRLGICMDCCHVWDAGYDIVEELDAVLEQFDQILGMERLRAVHINDSRNGIESHKDRHAMVGEGMIGKDAIVRIINHPSLRELPFVLETPTDLKGHGEEIRMLRSEYLQK